MTTITQTELMNALPYARRYARALCGSQTNGDKLVSECLPALRQQPHPKFTPREHLYALLTQHFNNSNPTALHSGLSQLQRQLLLLTSLEDIPPPTAAAITDTPLEEAHHLLKDARDKLRRAASTTIMIIEDEPIIAMDIEDLVTQCGHKVVGIAGSEEEAIALAEKTKPGLILADINLGIGGDGAIAVRNILRTHRIPVIFVTAYPERLLTGKKEEPIFVITKPFEPLTLAIATYQAVTGGVNFS